MDQTILYKTMQFYIKMGSTTSMFAFDYGLNYKSLWIALVGVIVELLSLFGFCQAPEPLMCVLSLNQLSHLH